MHVIDRIDDARLRDLCGRGEFFWLDLTAPSDDDIRHLGELLGLHPLAVEDSIHFGQRPKLDVYGDNALLVLQGGREQKPEDQNEQPLEEIHLYLSGAWIVTLHRDRFDDLERLRAQLEQSAAAKSEQYYVYKVVDAIVDSFFPILADLDEEIDDLEDAIVAGAKRRQLEEIFRLKRLLLRLRKAVVPMRDVFAREADQIVDLAGLEADSRDYFRDVYDHLIRITDELDSYQEMITSCTDLYLSTVANRQGEVSKQLTIVASVFLPLSFLTGFFGMNFDWEVDHVLKGPWLFLFLGIGSMLVSVAALWWWFHRKGWTGRDD
ncbi:magnesium/cobalt transporter CorA [Schumannella luteola]|uniref:Magnesium transport protein CorA n=1 Tax=Schumannella luteola TaxID=472059 RepID=A0A852YDP2_9MICO|nr:magnesium/cobalt transporter CorA [Schumannella luteola]NYG99912.1 magnesium transporter [Schumannella luteola]TPW90508.1 magnesium/cobalt transporter CorA [Schumannella luteola]